MRLPPLPKNVKGALQTYRVVTGTIDGTNAGEHEISRIGCELRVTALLPLAHQWHAFLHELVHKWEMEGGFLMKDEPGDSDVDRLAMAMCADFIRNGWTLPGG